MKSKIVINEMQGDSIENLVQDGYRTTYLPKDSLALGGLEPIVSINGCEENTDLFCDYIEGKSYNTVLNFNTGQLSAFYEPQEGQGAVILDGCGDNVYGQYEVEGETIINYLRDDNFTNNLNPKSDESITDQGIYIKPTVESKLYPTIYGDTTVNYLGSQARGATNATLNRSCSPITKEGLISFPESEVNYPGVIHPVEIRGNTVNNLASGNVGTNHYCNGSKDKKVYNCFAKHTNTMESSLTSTTDVYGTSLLSLFNGTKPWTAVDKLSTKIDDWTYDLATNPAPQPSAIIDFTPMGISNKLRVGEVVSANASFKVDGSKFKEVVLGIKSIVSGEYINQSFKTYQLSDNGIQTVSVANSATLNVANGQVYCQLAFVPRVAQEGVSRVWVNSVDMVLGKYEGLSDWRQSYKSCDTSDNIEFIPHRYEMKRLHSFDDNFRNTIATYNISYDKSTDTYTINDNSAVLNIYAEPSTLLGDIRFAFNFTPSSNLKAVDLGFYNGESIHTGHGTFTNIDKTTNFVIHQGVDPKLDAPIFKISFRDSLGVTFKINDCTIDKLDRWTPAYYDLFGKNPVVPYDRPSLYVSDTGYLEPAKWNSSARFDLANCRKFRVSSGIVEIPSFNYVICDKDMTVISSGQGKVLDFDIKDSNAKYVLVSVSGGATNLLVSFDFKIERYESYLGITYRDDLSSGYIEPLVSQVSNGMITQPLFLEAGDYKYESTLSNPRIIFYQNDFVLGNLGSNGNFTVRTDGFYYFKADGYTKDYFIKITKGTDFTNKAKFNKTNILSKDYKKFPTKLLGFSTYDGNSPINFSDKIVRQRNGKLFYGENCKYMRIDNTLDWLVTNRGDGTTLFECKTYPGTYKGSFVTNFRHASGAFTYTGMFNSVGNVYNANQLGVFIGDNRIYIRMPNTDADTVEKFKTWLTSNAFDLVYSIVASGSSNALSVSNEVYEIGYLGGGSYNGTTISYFDSSRISPTITTFSNHAHLLSGNLESNKTYTLTMWNTNAPLSDVIIDFDGLFNFTIPRFSFKRNFTFTCPDLGVFRRAPRFFTINCKGLMISKVMLHEGDSQITEPFDGFESVRAIGPYGLQHYSSDDNLFCARVYPNCNKEGVTFGNFQENNKQNVTITCQGLNNYEAIYYLIQVKPNTEYWISAEFTEGWFEAQCGGATTTIRGDYSDRQRPITTDSSGVMKLFIGGYYDEKYLTPNKTEKTFTFKNVIVSERRSYSGSGFNKDFTTFDGVNSLPRINSEVYSSIKIGKDGSMYHYDKVLETVINVDSVYYEQCNEESMVFICNLPDMEFYKSKSVKNNINILTSVVPYVTYWNTRFEGVMLDGASGDNKTTIYIRVNRDCLPSQTLDGGKAFLDGTKVLVERINPIVTKIKDVSNYSKGVTLTAFPNCTYQVHSFIKPTVKVFPNRAFLLTKELINGKTYYIDANINNSSSNLNCYILGQVQEFIRPKNNCILEFTKVSSMIDKYICIGGLVGSNFSFNNIALFDKKITIPYFKQGFNYPESPKFSIRNDANYFHSSYTSSYIKSFGYYNNSMRTLAIQLIPNTEYKVRVKLREGLVLGDIGVLDFNIGGNTSSDYNPILVRDGVPQGSEFTFVTNEFGLCYISYGGGASDAWYDEFISKYYIQIGNSTASEYFKDIGYYKKPFDFIKDGKSTQVEELLTIRDDLGNILREDTIEYHDDGKQYYHKRTLKVKFDGRFNYQLNEGVSEYNFATFYVRWDNFKSIMGVSWVNLNKLYSLECSDLPLRSQVIEGGYDINGIIFEPSGNGSIYIRLNRDKMSSVRLSSLKNGGYDLSVKSNILKDFMQANPIEVIIPIEEEVYPLTYPTDGYTYCGNNSFLVCQSDCMNARISYVGNYQYKTMYPLSGNYDLLVRGYNTNPIIGIHYNGQTISDDLVGHKDYIKRFPLDNVKDLTTIEVSNMGNSKMSIDYMMLVDKGKTPRHWFKGIKSLGDDVGYIDFMSINPSGNMALSAKFSVSDSTYTIQDVAFLPRVRKVDGNLTFYLKSKGVGKLSFEVKTAKNNTIHSHTIELDNATSGMYEFDISYEVFGGSASVDMHRMVIVSSCAFEITDLHLSYGTYNAFRSTVVNDSNINDDTGEVTETGGHTISNNFNICKPSTKYEFKVFGSINDSTYMAFYWYDSNFKFISKEFKQDFKDKVNGTTSPANARFFKIKVNKANGAYLCMVEGTYKYKAYNQNLFRRAFKYRDENNALMNFSPMHKINDSIRDYNMLHSDGNHYYHVNTYKLVFNGSENYDWRIPDWYDKNGKFVPLEIVLDTHNLPRAYLGSEHVASILCVPIKPTRDTRELSKEGIRFTSNYCCITFDASKLETLNKDGVNKFLKSLNDNGTPLEVVYPIDEKVYLQEPYNYRTANNEDGLNFVLINDNFVTPKVKVFPTPVYCDYLKSNTRYDIHCQFYTNGNLTPKVKVNARGKLNELSLKHNTLGGVPVSFTSGGGDNKIYIGGARPLHMFSASITEGETTYYTQYFSKGVQDSLDSKVLHVETTNTNLLGNYYANLDNYTYQDGKYYCDLVVPRNQSSDIYAYGIYVNASRVADLPYEDGVVRFAISSALIYDNSSLVTGEREFWVSPDSQNVRVWFSVSNNITSPKDVLSHIFMFTNIMVGNKSQMPYVYPAQSTFSMNLPTSLGSAQDTQDILYFDYEDEVYHLTKNVKKLDKTNITVNIKSTTNSSVTFVVPCTDVKDGKFYSTRPCTLNSEGFEFTITMLNPTVDKILAWVASDGLEIQYATTNPQEYALSSEYPLMHLNSYGEGTWALHRRTKYCPNSYLNTSSYIVKDLKPNTKYTCQVIAKGNIDTNAFRGAYLSGTKLASKESFGSTFTITTPNDLQDNRLAFFGKGLNASNVMLIEGDIPASNITRFFEGKSYVGDLCKNKLQSQEVLVGLIDRFDGSLLTTSSYTKFRSSFAYTEVQEGLYYSISAQVGNVVIPCRCFTYDSNKLIMTNSTNGYIKIPVGAKYLNFSCDFTGHEDIIDTAKYQIQIGKSISSYEDFYEGYKISYATYDDLNALVDYKEILLQEPLRRKDNVYDRLYVDNFKLKLSRVLDAELNIIDEVITTLDYDLPNGEFYILHKIGGSTKCLCTCNPGQKLQVFHNYDGKLIELPIPLLSKFEGTTKVADKLYWDSVKGHYCINQVLTINDGVITKLETPIVHDLTNHNVKLALDTPYYDGGVALDE